MKRITAIMIFLLSAQYAMSQQRNIILPEAPKQHAYKDYSMKNEGFWASAEIEGASSVMLEKPNMQFTAATVTAGYRFNEYISLGAGMGARIYVHNAELRAPGRRCTIPVFANARGNILCKHNRKAAPYWSMNLGGVTSEGLYVSPTLGYSIGGLRNNFLVGISYSVSTFRDAGGTHRAYSYFGIKLGYEF